MTPKRQHFIPILHLKHFTGDAPTGHVWTYDAETGEARSATPENTAVEGHFYSAENPDGTMDARIEEYLSKVESAAAPVYEALMRGDIPDDPQQRADFATFLALMYARTPAMRRMSGEMIGRGIQIMGYAYGVNKRTFDTLIPRFEREEGRVLNAELKERLRRDFLDPSGYVVEVPKERTFHVLGVADKLAPLLYEMKWSITTAAQGYFVTSDNPLVREVDPRTRHRFYGDGGFLNKTAEVTFPLSPKLLLIMSWNQGTRLAALKREVVDAANRTRAANSDQYLYAHIHDKRLKRLVAEFRDSRPGMTTRGFGPEKFARVTVRRRSRPAGPPVR